MGEIGDKQVVPSLLKFLAKADDFVYGDVLIALGQFGDRKSLQPLLEALSSINDDIKECAIIGLGYLGDIKAEPVLEELKYEKSKHENAINEALEQIRQINTTNLT